jgi:hypothetical protein
MLMLGWDLIQQSFEVVSVKNYFRSPVRIGARWVEILVVIPVPKGGTGPEKIPHVCELRLEEASFWKAQTSAEAHLEEFRDGLRRQLGPAGLHTEAIVYLTKTVLFGLPESHNLRQFRRRVAKHFGSAVCAWRRFSGGDRLMTFARFRELCRTLSCHDHSTEYWAELVQGQGVASLFELDPEAVALLSRLRARLMGLKESVGQDETMELVFVRLTFLVNPKPKQQGHLELQEFRMALRQLGFASTDADRVFRYLEKQSGNNASVTAADFAWLKKLAKLVDLEAVTLATVRPAEVDNNDLQFVASSDSRRSELDVFYNFYSGGAKSAAERAAGH